MKLTMGSKDNGVFELSMAVPNSCQPYYFIFETSRGERFRLPEDPQYMFGTAWDPWDWWSPPSPCTENHYYNGGREWIQNGGPSVPRNSSTCQGCIAASNIQRLW